MSKIVATGSYLPEMIVSNTELVNQTGIDSSDEWISQRTGIKQRHFALDDETVSHIAAKAAEDTIQSFDKDIRQEIQLIIVATMSSRLPTPSVANQVQRTLGIQHSLAFDVSSACSGFITALETAEKISRDYETGYTLVIGAEKMSDILDFDDRGTSILFGDGAGAVLIENDGEGLLEYQSDLHSVPDETNSICLATEEEADNLMSMAGRDVFNFVLRQVIPSLSDFIKDQVGEVDYIISHQANARFIDIIADKIGIDAAKLPVNIQNVANTSAGSIPILLDELVKEDKITLDGSQKIVLVGFGGGLTWGQASLVI